MSDDHCNCDLCAATKRVFGDRFAGCAEFSNDMVRETAKIMRERTETLLAELDKKHEANLVSEKDYEALRLSIKRSFTLAAATVPAQALVEGCEGDPGIMMHLVEQNLTRLLELSLKNNPIMDALSKILKKVESDDKNIN